ncbi:unnamed protein product [Pieris macdunnoughi]|uniref:FLYWCH-type domain-containing protein n=1 Tax=Pieris macdunnoughi TaxID=345717 RepID=A0A821QF96_9NEOP|nr:unnamed protein product [Pieris macdunnoughi]
MPIFGTSQDGTKVILFSGFRYYQHLFGQARDSKKRKWRCIVHGYGPFIAHSKRGNPILVLKGYRYSLKVTKRFDKTVIRRWQCSTHTNRGCLATIITHDQHIVKMKNEHNHVQRHIIFETTTSRGTSALSIDGFEYVQQYKNNVAGVIKIRWQCTKRSLGCKASVHTVDVEYIRSIRGKPLIKHEDYTYHLTSEVGLKARWRCSTHNNRGCNATIVMVNGLIVSRTGPHTHLPSNQSKQL